jgi:hypothetical protein
MIYRSNLVAPDLAPAFRLHAPAIQMFGHDVPSDPDFDPSCGFWTHDEAAILYNIAKGVGGDWVDIGARTGWTTMHLAAAQAVTSVSAIEPEYGFGMLPRMLGNVSAFAETDVITPFAERSREFFNHTECYFRGFVIDGDHDNPQPLCDAFDCAIAAESHSVIVLHDFWGRPIRDAVDWLISQDWHCRVYSTPNGVACLWSEESMRRLIPEHVPDPAVDWNEVKLVRCEGWDFSRCE